MMAADYMKWVPVAVIAAGVIASAATGQMQLNNNGTADAARSLFVDEELDDLSEGVDENEESIEVIQRTLIQRQGEQALQVQRIETEQKSQGEDLDKIILLLQARQP